MFYKHFLLFLLILAADNVIDLSEVIINGNLLKYEAVTAELLL